MFPACSTCRFFGGPASIDAGCGEGDDYYERESGHHACVRIIHGNASGGVDVSLLNEKAVVTDGSGYAAKLRVLPTFGCALHEVKA
jgi:hypothetical protein